MGDLGATFAGIVTGGSLLLAIAVAARPWADQLSPRRACSPWSPELDQPALDHAFDVAGNRPLQLQWAPGSTRDESVTGP
jgi:hypothetical protein